MLRRFADARLRRQLADATDLVRRLNGLLRQKTAEARTNYDLAQRWKAIALYSQEQLADERARNKETARQQAEQICPNCAPGYDCERGIYTPETTP